MRISTLLLMAAAVIGGIYLVSAFSGTETDSNESIATATAPEYTVPELEKLIAAKSKKLTATQEEMQAHASALGNKEKSEFVFGGKVYPRKSIEDAQVGTAKDFVDLQFELIELKSKLSSLKK